MIARFQAAPGKNIELRNRLLEMVRLTHQERGFEYYELHVDRENDDTYYFTECWFNQDALDAHMNTPHVTAIVEDSERLTTTGIEITFMHRL